jgi:hypothetical protein
MSQTQPTPQNRQRHVDSSIRPFHTKHPENDMTALDIASQAAATLETAPTRYIEGRGIRFAYRRLGPSKRRWFSCSTSRATSMRGIPPSSTPSRPIAL